MAQLRIYLLGIPSFELDEEPIYIKRRKDLALLVYLAVTAQTHTREALAALFWPEHDSSRAFANLRRSIWGLKQILGEELLVVAGDTLGLHQGPEVWSDVVEFQSQLATLQGHKTYTTAFDSLTDAVDLYKGDFMAGFNLPDSHSFDDWQYYKRDELRRELGTALETLAVEFGQAGYFERAIHYAQRWLSLDNLNEAPHRMLMTLYVWSGERTAAIRQYQECVRTLQVELGLPPEEDTQRLFERIQSGELEKKRPSEDAVLALVSNLPVPPTPFVGRKPELDQLNEYLCDPDCRLLTLFGPGGVGKTRLAIQAAEETIEHFPNGIYFVSLAGLDNPQSILPAIVGSLHFHLTVRNETPEEQLLNYLRQKRLLLVLDNFEHLMAGAVFIGEIIAQAKGLKILTTSREKLGLQGEWVYEVGGMRFPEATEPRIEDIERYSAIQLFAQSAHRAQAGFRLSDQDLPSVVRITQLVRGIPLALELAAAWVPLLSCDEIVQEIERGLDFLETSMQDVPERQRSLRAVFDHSWRLLSERERKSFAHLSVFSGGFTLQAAREIFGISPLELREMVDKSLLIRTPAGRYELHGLLRRYAAEKLAQNSQDDIQAHNQHSEYFCKVMVTWKESIYATQKQPQIMDELNADLDNAIAAWNWALEHQQLERLNQGIETLAIFFLRRVRAEEGLSLFSRTRQRLTDCSSPQTCHLHARLYAWEGYFHLIQRNYESAERHFLETLSILEDPEIDKQAAREDRALVHWGLGYQAYQTGYADRSKKEYEISLKLFQELGKPYYEAEVLLDLASLTAYLIWDAELAEEHWKKALEIKKSLGDQLSIAGILYERAVIAAYHIGDTEKSSTLFQESSDILEQFRDLASKAQRLACLAQIAHLNTHYQECHELWEKQLQIYEELGNREGTAWTYTNMGLTYKSLGNYEQAEAHVREALKILEPNPEGDLFKGINRWSLGIILLVRGRVSEAIKIIETSLQIDRQMTGKHNLGRDLGSLSLAEFLLGDKESAWTHISEAIELFLQYRHYDWMVYTVSTLAVLLVDKGEIERALILYGLITCYPEAAASQFFEDAYWRHVHKAAADMQPDKVEEAITRGRQLDIWEYAKEVLGELKSSSA